MLLALAALGTAWAAYQSRQWTGLFFAGISAKLHDTRSRATILGLSCTAFAAAAIWLATLPVQLTT